MSIKNIKNQRVLVLILFLNVVVDQISKLIARKEIAYYEHIPIIKNFFTLTKVENTGAFLSLGDNMPYALRLVILSGLPIIVLGFGLYYLFSHKNLPKSMQIAICFLIGGGIGNLYDRIVHGSVTDFMHMDFGIFQTGVFNFADISIMIGVGILLVQSFRKNLKNNKKQEEDVITNVEHQS
ncbi:signal peptidase II [Pedobacter rhizosphaerae]|uniref:Lipoprotein signal peptidase n=1 Tax=Pedobacter rhizosphaerae TaxID=390241 RepID=A0A1H9V985_9SPHI|nr:signal peptidase II [Pedobacter rhizosphaerae]SES17974.1 signal peptidase II [Pedobacter rhizosphaerae]